MTQQNDLVQKLKDLLEKECSFQEKYLDILENEKQALLKFDTTEVRRWAESRDQLNQEISVIQNVRLELLRSDVEQSLGLSTDIKLSDWIARYCDKNYRKELLALASKLKKLVKKTQRRARELSGSVEFSLGMVSSTMSLLWSASNVINKTYSARGKLEEKVLPGSKARLGVLKTA